MPSVFSKIIAGEIPSHRIAEDDHFCAFLDVNPLVPGHTLVVPKQEIDYLFDIGDERLGEMIVFAKRVAAAIRKAIPCRKVGLAVIGLEVPHAHMHLVPMQREEDIRFGREKLSPSEEELAKVAKSIRDKYR